MAQDWPDKLITVLCTLLKERRVGLGVSIYQVSQHSGVSQQAISNYEKLRRRPTLECLIKISLALDLRPSELLAITETRVGEPGKRPNVLTKPTPRRKS